VRKESFFGGGVRSVIPITVLHLAAYAIPPKDRFALDWVEGRGGSRAARGRATLLRRGKRILCRGTTAPAGYIDMTDT
jgi:hypothetical protein